MSLFWFCFRCFAFGVWYGHNAIFFFLLLLLLCCYLRPLPSFVSFSCHHSSVIVVSGFLSLHCSCARSLQRTCARIHRSNSRHITEHDKAPAHTHITWKERGKKIHDNNNKKERKKEDERKRRRRIEETNCGISCSSSRMQQFSPPLDGVCPSFVSFVVFFCFFVCSLLFCVCQTRAQITKTYNVS